MNTNPPPHAPVDATDPATTDTTEAPHAPHAPGGAAGEGPTMLRGAGEEALRDDEVPPCTCDHEDGPCTCERARVLKGRYLRRG